MLLDLSEIFVCPRCRPAQGLVVLVDEIRDRRVLRGHLGCPECEARYPLVGGTLRLDRDVAGGTTGAAPGGDPAGRGASDAAAADEEAAVRRPSSRAHDDTPEPAGGDPAPELLRGVGPEESALRLGALLGLPEAEGPFLLGPGLDALAAPLAGLADDEEVLSLVRTGGPEQGEAPSGPDGALLPGRDPRPGRGGEERTRRGGEPAGEARVTRIVGASAAELPIFSGRLGGVAVLGGDGGALREAVRVLGQGGRAVVVEPARGVAESAGELPADVVARDERALVVARGR